MPQQFHLSNVDGQRPDNLVQGEIRFHVLTGDLFCAIEIHRADDTGGGAPDGSTDRIIEVVGATGPFSYIDRGFLIPGDDFPIDEDTSFDVHKWYRIRAVSAGKDPSAFVPKTSPFYAKGTARQFDGPIGPLPQYPLINIIELPTTMPQNAKFELRSNYDHDDLVIRFVDLAVTADVPQQEDFAAWTTFTGEFEVSRDATALRRIAAFGEINGILGPTTQKLYEADLSPLITDFTNVIQIEDGTVDTQVRRTANVNAKVKSIDVYRRKDNWPTVDGTQTADLDPAYFRGSITSVDGFQYTDGGFGGQYRFGDVVHDIWVPRDGNGDAGQSSGDPRPRKEATYTVLDLSASPPPAFTSCTRTNVSNGTSCTCGSRRQVKMDWAVQNAPDIDFEIQAFQKVAGGGEEAWPSASCGSNVYAPSAGTTGNRDCRMEGSGGPTITVDLVLKLVRKVGPVIEDTCERADTLSLGGSECPA